MECNKEEALRAKEIAEKKLEVQDYVAARKFILKAQQLFPALENVSQMLAVCDVHCAAQVKLNGCDMDWYGILQLDPTADDISIKKQYRKLALLLHPDKNKFSGAESAFKLIGEAMGVLSDQMKRTLHDMKRRASTNQNIAASKPSQFQSGAMNSANGHFYGMQQPGVQTQPGIHVRMQTQPAARHQAQPNIAASGPTFWTICPFCQIKYQYMRTVENRYLLCQNCQRPFPGRDMYTSVGNGANAAGGINSGYAWNASAIPQQQDFAKQGANVRGPGAVPMDGFTNETRYDQNFASNMAFQGGTSGAAARAASAPGDSYQEKAKKEADYLRQMQEKARQQAEAEKEARRKMKEEEKELKRREKEAEKKARAEEKAREALKKIEIQRKAKAEKAAGNEKPRKRLRKVKESSSSDSDISADGNITLEDDLSDDQRATVGDVGHNPRRSARSKRNVTYRVDVSDDEDFMNFPPSKKSREMKQGAGETAQNHAASSEENASEAKFEKDEPERMEKQSDTQNDMLHVLAEMAKKEISKRFQDNVNHNLRSEIADDAQVLKEEKDNEQRNSHLRKEEKSEEKEEACQPEGAKGIGENGVEKTTLKDDNKGSHLKSPSHSDSASSTPEPELFDVPDADFHDFDQDRTEGNIFEGQIWAVYDEVDGMPRFYLRVNKILTVTPFKVQISWLEWCPFLEEHDHWESEDLPVACGMYKMGKVDVLEGVNTFSHLVKWEKGKQKRHVIIYPKKGDIWAIYKNWQIDWENSDEDGGPKYEYEMVEVLTDFSEKTGVEVARLIKVDGFKTIFKRRVEQGVELTMHIPLNESLKFSHQVPAYKMTGEEKCREEKRGEEKCGILKGSWELDPASTPLELIHGEPIKSNAR